MNGAINPVKNPNLKEIVDADILKRPKIKKLYVDRDGLHCFLLAGHEMYYNNFYNSTVHKIQIPETVSIKSLDILKFKDDPKCFEIVVGTEDGKIFLGAISTNSVEPEVIMPFSQ